MSATNRGGKNSKSHRAMLVRKRKHKARLRMRHYHEDRGEKNIARKNYSDTKN